MNLSNIYVFSCFIFFNKYLFLEAKDSSKPVAELLEIEKSRLESGTLKCRRLKSSTADLIQLRISDKVDEAIACHIQYLVNNQQAVGWIWSSLGSLYTSAPEKAHFASVCFKKAAELDGSVVKYVNQWHYIGPFPIGKSESDGDPVEHFGGIRNISRYRYQTKFSMYSELATDGRIFWTALGQRSSTGYTNVSPNIAWSDLVNSLGSTGITEWQGWAVGEIAVNVAEVSVHVRCSGVTHVFIDSNIVAGDVYHREQYKFAIALKSGMHSVYVKLRAKGSTAFRCDFESSSAAFELHAPHFLPDLHDGRLPSGFVAVPVSNLHQSKWLRNLRFSLEDSTKPLGMKVRAGKKDVAVAPGQIQLVWFELLVADDFVLSPCNFLELSVKLSTSEGAKTRHIRLRCRQRHESFLFTFIDHDGSVQHAAAIRPLNDDCLREKCPVVLTLHGTTVPPQNQADSYKHMVNKEFVFGFKQAWLLAPTRHGAHNWEGPGSLTALTALKELAVLTERNVWFKGHQTTVDFVVFAGHSMGGHGSWHLAVNYPDMALAVVSLAGWIRKEDYGDSNLFFRHDIANSQIDTDVKAVLEKCVAENFVDRHIGNLKGVSALVRVGASDRTVHPFFARRMSRLLVEAGVNVTYRELADKEHWWWDTRETNDGGCVNDEEIRSFVNYFLSKKFGKPSEGCGRSEDKCSTDETELHHHSLYNPQDNDEVFHYTVSSVAFGGTVRGLKIVQQLEPHRQSTIKVEVTASEVSLLTTNVGMLHVCFNCPTPRPVQWKSKTIKLDGSSIIDADFKGDSICLCRDIITDSSADWSVNCAACQTLDSLSSRGPLTVGPARRVAERPFVIVTGTLGSQSVSQEIEKLAVYLANSFFLTSDTVVPIVRDIDLSHETAEKFNLIVVGNTDENMYTERFIDRLPVSYKNGVVTLRTCRYEDQPTGVLTLAPHDNAQLALLLFGSSLQGLRDIVSLATPTIPPMARSPFSNMIPDFIITGPQYRHYGPGGFLCSGFWGSHWDFVPGLTSCSYC